MPKIAILLTTALLLMTGCNGSIDINRLIDLDKIVLDPDTELTIAPSDLGYDYQTITIPVENGRSVNAWYVASPDPLGLMVVVPGSGDNRSLYVQLALPLLGDSGYDLLFMDYEGFGDSPGKATMQHCADDALAVVGYAMTRNENVILYGISLGSSLAVRAAAEYDVKAIVLDANLVVPDTVEYLASKLPPLAEAFLTSISPEILQAQLPEEFDTLKYVAIANGAKLIIHSPDDQLTPFVSATEVYQAAAAPKTFWQIYGDHGRMIRVEPDVYIGTVLSWLDDAISVK